VWGREGVYNSIGRKKVAVFLMLKRYIRGARKGGKKLSLSFQPNYSFWKDPVEFELVIKK